jgi:hypothetical protein
MTTVNIGGTDYDIPNDKLDSGEQMFQVRQRVTAEEWNEVMDALIAGAGGGFATAPPTLGDPSLITFGTDDLVTNMVDLVTSMSLPPGLGVSKPDGADAPGITIPFDCKIDVVSWQHSGFTSDDNQGEIKLQVRQGRGQGGAFAWYISELYEDATGEGPLSQKFEPVLTGHGASECATSSFGNPARSRVMQVYAGDILALVATPSDTKPITSWPLRISASLRLRPWRRDSSNEPF